MKRKNIKIAGFVLASALLVGSLVGCGKSDSSVKTEISQEETTAAGEFASFSGKDLDGNVVDQTILDGHKATVLNFWFNGCSACVDEMPDLEKFNEQLKEKNAELVGVNVDSPDKENNEASKEILKKQGASYKNIQIAEGDKALDYMEEIMAFPTTVVVDKNGNIIGEPICGSLDESMMQEIKNRIDNMDDNS